MTHQLMLTLFGSLALALVQLVSLAAAQGSGPTQVIQWDPALNATSYDIERSTNGGSTWAVDLPGILPAACVGTPTRCSATVVNVPLNAYTLYRIVAINGTLRTTRADIVLGTCRGLPTCPPPVANVGAP